MAVSRCGEQQKQRLFAAVTPFDPQGEVGAPIPGPPLHPTALPPDQACLPSRSVTCHKQRRLAGQTEAPGGSLATAGSARSQPGLPEQSCGRGPVLSLLAAAPPKQAGLWHCLSPSVGACKTLSLLVLIFLLSGY